jgi:hypothetical protein
MNEQAWENMVDEQAKAFAVLCGQNQELTKLVKKYDTHGLNDRELDRMIELMDHIQSIAVAQSNKKL